MQSSPYMDPTPTRTQKHLDVTNLSYFMSPQITKATLPSIFWHSTKLAIVKTFLKTSDGKSFGAKTLHIFTSSAFQGRVCCCYCCSCCSCPDKFFLLLSFFFLKLPFLSTVLVLLILLLVVDVDDVVCNKCPVSFSSNVPFTVHNSWNIMIPKQKIH